MASRSDPDSPTVTIGGHRIRLTHLDKVLYPETGTTKADVLEYYSVVADLLIPYARNRPATRKRWVHGVGTAEEPAEAFFQKNLDDTTPDWITRRTVRHSDHDNEYPLVNNAATLTWLGQIAALEIHVPQWQFGASRAGEPAVRRNPDRLVLDLDPGEGTGLPECAEVARLAREILTGMGLEPYPVTSGSKGIQLYAALDGSQTSDAISSVAHELARALESDHPELVVSDMKRSLRPGKVLVDWSQNSANKTTIAPYSLRGRARPTVAAPRTWRELSSRSLAQLDYSQMMKRIQSKGDLLSPLLESDGGSLGNPGDPGDGDGGGEERDRLHIYRSKRDANKTPEPVPAGRTPGSSGNSFVIQEHHARRLHWDFRLEHDGVLVSWALPKGVPTESGKNHLAVQTEDHPLEYGTFEGTIPAGEYGAGEVTIWDSGTVELEKWREGKEVIATLHGEQHGPAKYALIHTGGAKGNQWLIHLMHLDEAETAETAKTSTAKTSSAKTSTAKASPRKSDASKAGPSELRPMLATLGDEAAFGARFEADADGDVPDDDVDWAFEMKWDGIRVIAEITVGNGDDDPGSVQLFTRTGVDVTARYPELHDLPALLTAGTPGGRTVLDGEVVALTAANRPDFGRLQNRMNLTKPAEIARARQDTPVHYFVFDLLESDSRSQVGRGYDDRRSELDSVLSDSPVVQVPPAFDGDLQAALDASRQLGLEGVMAKRRDARYLPGKRSDAWIKLKHHRAQEVVVAGWRPGRGARANRIGSLLLGLPEGDVIRYVGRVGTGFSDAQLDEIMGRLRSRARATSPLVDVPAADARDANWVRADLVAEVEFAEWTGTGRLRQPAWRGWRPDKKPGDLRIEST